MIDWISAFAVEASALTLLRVSWRTKPVWCMNPQCSADWGPLFAHYKSDCSAVAPGRIHHLWQTEPPFGAFVCRCGHVTMRHADPPPDAAGAEIAPPYSARR